MTKRCMAEVVSQRQGFRQILVESEGAADRACDLRHFEAVGQPGAVMVALVIDKDLGFVGQPAEGRRMNDAVPISLKRRPHRMLGLPVEPPAAFFRLRRIGCGADRSGHDPSLRRPPARVHYTGTAPGGVTVSRGPRRGWAAAIRRQVPFSPIGLLSGSDCAQAGARRAQATDNSDTKTFPRVSGLRTSERTQSVAPTQAPASIGIVSAI